MPSRQYTVGIIGLGYGRAHIAGFQAAGVKVVALCQRVIEAAAKLASQYQVPHVFGRWQDMLAQARPDNRLAGKSWSVMASHKGAALQPSCARI